MIIITYESIDRYKTHRGFTYLSSAQRWAQKWIGKAPTLGSTYAISDDGIGKITVTGCTLKELFPEGF